jgi:hypothetical protein
MTTIAAGREAVVFGDVKAVASNDSASVLT